MKLAATANPRERQGNLGQFPTASPVAVERLARSLGIPRRQVEARRWRLPDGSGFYPPRYRWCLLMKAVVEKFCPAFAPGSDVPYLADTGNKFTHHDTARLAARGVTLDSAAKFPDIIVHHTAKNWLLLIEVVTSAGQQIRLARCPNEQSPAPNPAPSPPCATRCCRSC